MAMNVAGKTEKLDAARRPAPAAGAGMRLPHRHMAPAANPKRWPDTAKAMKEKGK